MIEIIGKYTNAKIFTDIVESSAIKQIQFLCNHPLCKDKKIRIMPDVCPGKSTVVGLTVELGENIIPSLLGPDIGCGVLAFHIDGKTLNDYAKLDKVIRNKIPYGGNHMKKCSKYLSLDLKEQIKLLEFIPKELKINSFYELGIQSLGGGNHFISLEKGDTGTYLLVHTGSRTLGKDINLYYCKKALTQNLYKGGEEKQLSYLDRSTSKEYLQAVKIANYYAYENRKAIALTIIKEMDWEYDYYIDNPHNYISDYKNILRKGAIELDPFVSNFIPMNMRDGTLITIGNKKYDEDWNYSGPHGAGRIFSREDAKNLSMEEYKQDMQNIYSTSVKITTLDECPRAYKSMSEIINNLQERCIIKDHLKPLYNFKAN